MRERGDRLSAGINEVVPFDEDFEPPYWVTNPPAELTPRRNGGSNGNGNSYSNGNGHTDVDAASVVYTPRVRAADAPVLRVAEEATVRYDAGVLSTPEPALPTPSPAYGSPIVAQGLPPLHLMLVESSDEEGDQRRLASVFKLLQSRPGNDDVFLTIRTREGETIDLLYPAPLSTTSFALSCKRLSTRPS